MNFKELANNLGLEEDEYMELIELFIEIGMSDLDKVQFAVEEGDEDPAAGWITINPDYRQLWHGFVPVGARRECEFAH